jgi:hypothetical protein
MPDKRKPNTGDTDFPTRKDNLHQAPGRNLQEDREAGGHQGHTERDMPKNKRQEGSYREGGQNEQMNR